MAGFQNSNSTLLGTTSSQVIDTSGFINGTNSLTANGAQLPVDTRLVEGLPAGSNLIGLVGISSALPTGTNHIGEVSVADGTTIKLQDGSQIKLSAPLPAGTNEIGIVSLKSGQQVVLATGSQVALAAGAAHIGAVAIDNIVTITGSVQIAAGTNQIGSVKLDAGTNQIGAVSLYAPLPAGTNKLGSFDLASPIPAGTNNIGQITLAPGSTIAVTGANFSNVALAAGTNKIGSVDLASAVPTGTNSIGFVGLNAGTNSIGLVGLNAGSNKIGIVDIHGQTRTSLKRQISVDTNGSILPPNAAVVETLVNLTANTSTQLLASNPDRILYTIQLTTVDNVLISIAGNALNTINDAGTLIYSGGLVGASFTPPLVTTNPITAFCGQDTKVRVTEFVRT